MIRKAILAMAPLFNKKTAPRCRAPNVKRSMAQRGGGFCALVMEAVIRAFHHWRRSLAGTTQRNLFQTIQGSFPGIIFVDIDHAIAFLHFAAAEADDINDPPRRIA